MLQQYGGLRTFATWIRHRSCVRQQLREVCTRISVARACAKSYHGLCSKRCGGSFDFACCVWSATDAAQNLPEIRTSGLFVPAASTLATS